jgi:predicted TIM-barrel fold metal-dependent hydrolase
MAEIWNKYDPTAARPHPKPGRTHRPKSLTFDMHAHVGIPAAAQFVAPHFDPMTTPLVRWQSDHTRAVNAKQEGDLKTRITPAGFDQRLKDLDAMGLDMQLVMPPPPQCYYTVPVEIAVKAAQIVNDGIAEFVARAPDRYVALGTVPMPDGHEAAKELERAMKQLGFKGAQVLTNVDGRELSDPAFRAVLGESRGTRRAHRHPSERVHGRQAFRALLLQQRHRQPARDDDRGALPHLRRRAGAAPEPEDPGRAWRRVSRRLLGPDRPCLGRARGLQGRPAEPADQLS